MPFLIYLEHILIRHLPDTHRVAVLYLRATRVSSELCLYIQGYPPLYLCICLEVKSSFHRCIASVLRPCCRVEATAAPQSSVGRAPAEVVDFFCFFSVSSHFNVVDHILVHSVTRLSFYGLSCRRRTGIITVFEDRSSPARSRCAATALDYRSRSGAHSYEGQC